MWPRQVLKFACSILLSAQEYEKNQRCYDDLCYCLWSSDVFLIGVFLVGFSCFVRCCLRTSNGMRQKLWCRCKTFHNHRFEIWALKTKAASCISSFSWSIFQDFILSGTFLWGANLKWIFSLLTATSASSIEYTFYQNPLVFDLWKIRDQIPPESRRTPKHNPLFLSTFPENVILIHPSKSALMIWYIFYWTMDCLLFYSIGCLKKPVYCLLNIWWMMFFDYSCLY